MTPVIVKLLKTVEVDQPTSNHMFKVHNRSTITRSEICSKLTTNTPEKKNILSHKKINFHEASMEVINGAIKS